MAKVMQNAQDGATMKRSNVAFESLLQVKRHSAPPFFHGSGRGGTIARRQCSVGP